MVSFLRDFLEITWPEMMKEDANCPLSRASIIFQSADTNLKQLVLYLKQMFKHQHTSDRAPAWIDADCAAAVL